MITRRKNGFLKGEEKLSGDDVREGVTAVISVKLGEPQFEGQTKAKLGNPEVRTAVEGVLAEAFEEFLEKNPNDARKILEKCYFGCKSEKSSEELPVKPLLEKEFWKECFAGKIS